MESQQAAAEHSLTEMLPNRLVGYVEELHGETVGMATREKEKYRCILPEVKTAEGEVRG